MANVNIFVIDLQEIVETENEVKQLERQLLAKEDELYALRAQLKEYTSSQTT